MNNKGRNSCFVANGPVTRAEAATMIVSVMGYEIETEGENAFTDIEGNWYTDYVNTAYAHEIISGKSEGVFDPTDDVNRAEMVTMIHSTMKENFEIGQMALMSTDILYTKFKITNAEGQIFDFDYEGTDEEGGTIICDIPDYQYNIIVPSGFVLQVPLTGLVTYESEYGEVEGLNIFGVNSYVDITGTNIDKVQVNADGTVCLYGTDMDYTVSITNMAHTLEYSETGADDVVLKVVDKRLVEITE